MVPADGQLTLKDGEALGHCWVAVLADNAGSDEGSEFGYCPPLWVLPRKLEDRGALASDRTLGPRRSVSASGRQGHSGRDATSGRCWSFCPERSMSRSITAGQTWEQTGSS